MFDIRQGGIVVSRTKTIGSLLAIKRDLSRWETGKVWPKV